MGNKKICKLCMEEFFSESGKERFCKNCKQNKIRSKRKEWKKIREKETVIRTPKITIEDVLRWAGEHKKKTGVYLSYSKALEEMKKEGYKV